MGVPVATIADLQMYLGLDAIDPDRAALVLDLAQSRCELYVSPLPSQAKGVVLAVAARAFNNVISAQQMGLGSAQVSFGASGSHFGIGGLYVSKAEQKDLRLMAGRSAAFSVNMLRKGASEVQTVTVTATAGTFTLALISDTSAPIAYNAAASAMQAALEGVGSIGVGNVSVALVGTVYTLTFQGRLATTPLPTLTANVAALTGTVVVAEVTPGAYAPGQNLPWWDRTS